RRCSGGVGVGGVGGRLADRVSGGVGCGSGPRGGGAGAAPAGGAGVVRGGAASAAGVFRRVRAFGGPGAAGPVAAVVVGAADAGRGAGVVVASAGPGSVRFGGTGGQVGGGVLGE